MNTRIRYQETAPGVLTSRRLFTLDNGTEVKVELNLNEKKFRIIDAVTGFDIATGGNTKNISVLKIQSKKGLTALGVEFGDESRNRGEGTTGR